MKKLILVGGGSHANSVIDILQLEKKFLIHGIIDIKNTNKAQKKFKYLGSDNELKKTRKTIKYALVTIGFVKNYLPRVNAIKTLEKHKYVFPTIISPRAYISKSSKIGSGSIIFHNALINSGVCIGRNCIINTNALLEHDVKVGDNSHISTGVIVNGNVVIGNNTFIGSGTRISNNIKIGDNCFVKMGSNVTKNISNNKKF